MKVNNNQQLYTDLYNKPTGTNSYLNYDSAHPTNCKKSLPYSQLLRIKRICTKESDYIRNANKKLKEFEAKNYPKKILLDSIEKVNTLKRENLLKKKEKNNDDPATQDTYIICTFSLNYQKVPKLSKRNWDILARSSTTKDLHRNKLRISYKRPKNLREMLVKAKTNYHLPPTGDTNTASKEKQKCSTTSNLCKKQNCKYCKKLDTTGYIQHENKKLECKKYITCNSSNVIYCIKCT